MTKIIDSHAHTGRIGDLSCDAGQLLKAMDGFGIATAMISNISANELDNNNSSSPYKNQLEANREVLEECRASSGRLKGLFWITPTHGGYSPEIELFIKENRDIFVGLKSYPKGANLKFTYENYCDWLNLCRKLELPFCVHTEQDGCSNMEFVYEVARRCPDIRFIAVHMDIGGDRKKSCEYIKSLPNLYGDTTTVELQDVIHALQYCGSEKILFGSDAAVFGEDSYKRYVDFTGELPKKFTADDLDNLFWRNAERLFLSI